MNTESLASSYSDALKERAFTSLGFLMHPGRLVGPPNRVGRVKLKTPKYSKQHRHLSVFLTGRNEDLEVFGVGWLRHFRPDFTEGRDYQRVAACLDSS